MHKSHYQPSRSVHLFLVEEIRRRYRYRGDIVVHHVLEDSTSRLYIQIERRMKSFFGKTKISFERVEL